MEDIKQIMEYHFDKYPKMQIQDAIKLLYQGEFAGGHMIENPQASLDYLVKEMQTIQYNSDCEKYEKISMKASRINLYAVDKSEISAINDIFVRSANEVVPQEEVFLNNLELLKRLAKKGETPFSLEEATSFLEKYIEKGIGAVHHSEQYRQYYKPAYRVVLNTYLHL